MKITFQNQTVTDTENRTESIQTEKNTWGRDKIQRNKKKCECKYFWSRIREWADPNACGK
ncbi:MAG: hypothetical protein ACLU77_13830 [Waltera sp.]